MTAKRHLYLVLEAPLLSFGSTAIDNLRPTQSFPSASMLTGLLGNALGYQRTDVKELERLQSRLTYAARMDREPAGLTPLSDFQTAKLNKEDQGWTTWGHPEGRGGNSATYESPHLRHKQYHADLQMTIALRLEPPQESPSLGELAMALKHPARPLFIGRKSCIPSRPLYGGECEAATATEALLQKPAARAGADSEPARMFWMDGETGAGVTTRRSYLATQQRDWSIRLPGGRELCHEGYATRGGMASLGNASEGKADNE